MTHGCLKIFTEGDGRYILLHTHHTAMDTPQWVRMAPGFFALRRGDFLVGMAQEGNKDKKWISEQVGLIHRGQFFSPVSVAAMLVACQPDCYEVVPPDFMGELAIWGGQDFPDTLTIKDDQWIHKTQWTNMLVDFEEIVLNPMELAIEALWRKVQKNRTNFRCGHGENKEHARRSFTKTAPQIPMSIQDFIDDCVARNLSEKDMEFEAMRKFSKNTIKQAGGMKAFRDLYQQKQLSKPK